MFPDRVRTEQDAIAYLINCTLCTVDDLALKARPPIGELRRQCSIAQAAIDTAVAEGVDLSSTRVRNFPEGRTSVLEYVAMLRTQWSKPEIPVEKLKPAKDRRIPTIAEAIAFVTDCTLATVERMAMKASAAKSEIARQCSIAEQAIYWSRHMDVDLSGTRAAGLDGSALQWANGLRRQAGHPEMVI